VLVNMNELSKSVQLLRKRFRCSVLSLLGNDWGNPCRSDGRRLPREPPPKERVAFYYHETFLQPKKTLLASIFVVSDKGQSSPNYLRS